MGDEVLALNGQDVVGSTASQVYETLEPKMHRQNLVTFFLAKKDMPSRRCRVVLKRTQDAASAYTSPVSSVTTRTPPRT